MTPGKVSRIAALGNMFQDYIATQLERLKDTYPEVHEKLKLARARLTDASRPEDFQGIGIICRDAIISFANAIFSPDFVHDGTEVPAEDKAILRIEATLAHFGEKAGSDKLRRLAKSVLAYAMRLQHNQGATSEDAQRAALFTTLALGELAALIQTATRNLEWVQKYGVYKCPACGSAELQEDWFNEYETAWQYLTCTNCVWSSMFE